MSKTAQIVGDGLAGTWFAQLLTEKNVDFVCFGDGQTNTPPVAFAISFRVGPSDAMNWSFPLLRKASNFGEHRGMPRNGPSYERQHPETAFKGAPTTTTHPRNLLPDLVATSFSPTDQALPFERRP